MTTLHGTTRSGASISDGGRAMLHIDHLSGGYGDVPVLHQVALDLARNEVVGVLGCNGAGKSTLVKAVMGLLPQISGDIPFLDEPPARLRTNEISRRATGLGPQ